MQLDEYSDDELLEEVKHREFEIKITCRLVQPSTIEDLFKREREHNLIIGGVSFDLGT